MADGDLDTLEKRLLENPFDGELRHDYAKALERANRYADAIHQYQLVQKAAPDRAGPIVGRARCLLAAGKREEALNDYIRAKNLDDFEPDAGLEDLAIGSRPAGPSVAPMAIDGSNVVEFVRPGSTSVSFKDVAGMQSLKKTLRMKIIEPFRNPGLFSRFRKKAGGGVLLYGPPGCGKTLMARAIATECNATFISVGISDVLNMWIGESERNLSQLFAEARETRPCVLFFDELDALAYARSKTSSTHSRTIVNEFLAQLDGFDHDNDQVLILAATNMPWDVDPAMKRPGRFANQIFVPPPDDSAIVAMLELKLDEIPADPLDLAGIARRCRHFSGADIDGLIDQATEHALADMLDSGQERNLCQQDFEDALESITPSTVEWLQTARNLVKFAGADNSYKEVKRYLKSVRLY